VTGNVNECESENVTECASVQEMDVGMGVCRYRDFDDCRDQGQPCGVVGDWAVGS